MKTYLQAIILVLVCAVLTGCVTPADPNAMTVGAIPGGKRINKSVLLAVSGGQETDPLWSSQVSDADFATALQNTIVNNRLFSQVVRHGNSDYRLDVRLIRLRQPMIGFDMTVTSEVEWRLRHVQSDKLVWHETINRAFTATVGDAFVGVTRLKLANEGAIRENIKAGLQEISALSL